jgi:signal recognition particle subunit SRP54
MGDIVGLVERAAANVEQEDAERMAAKLAKGQFDLDDLRAQLRQMKAMGGLGALASMMPGVAQAKQAMASGQMDEKLLGRMEAIIGSMTPKERAKPELINARRKIRIAKGSGTTVMEVNRVLKMQLEMANAMKKLRKMGGMKAMAGMLGRMGNSPGGVAGGLAGLLGGGGGAFNKFNKR